MEKERKKKKVGRVTRDVVTSCEEKKGRREDINKLRVGMPTAAK